MYDDKHNRQTILVFSHLRWNFVFQRPQHLLTNLSKEFSIHFFEEAVTGEKDGYKVSENKGVIIITPELSEDGIDKDIRLKNIVDEYLMNHGLNNYLSWYYSPMFLPYTRHLTPSAVIFDCMDELSAFKYAPPELLDLEQELLELADIVFTGGQSLYEAKKDRNANVHCFPSSIDYNHFAQARNPLTNPLDQQDIPEPRIGFFGVIDERFDLELLSETAAKSPDVSFVVIGPVVKIDPESLPHADNIFYLGKKEYTELPEYISNWTLAMMPFALNESTRFISPTKTPEYLAAGKPVISTSINDVIHSYGSFDLVTIITNASEFNEAIKGYLENQKSEDWRPVDGYLSSMSWERTCNEMEHLINQVIEKHEQFL